MALMHWSWRVFGMAVVKKKCLLESAECRRFPCNPSVIAISLNPELEICGCCQIYIRPSSAFSPYQLPPGKGGASHGANSRLFPKVYRAGEYLNQTESIYHWRIKAWTTPCKAGLLTWIYFPPIYSTGHCPENTPVPGTVELERQYE